MRKADQVMIHVNFAESTTGSAVVNHHNLTIKVILRGEEILWCIVDGGSGVNVINKATYNRLGITNWDVCPFWLSMVDTRSVKPLGLLRKLNIVIGGHMFEMSTVVLALDAPGAYPLPLGRPWLCSTNIKQH